MTHKEHADKIKLGTPCTAAHTTFGGRCLNCGWHPGAGADLQLIAAIQAQQQVMSTEASEGDRTTWHIRRALVLNGIELWVLFNGERQESSPTSKASVQKWCADELAKKQ
jgi:hypothetical protein